MDTNDCDLTALWLEYDHGWQLHYRKPGVQGMVPMVGVQGYTEKSRREAKEMAEGYLDRIEPGWRN